VRALWAGGGSVVMWPSNEQGQAEFGLSARRRICPARPTISSPSASGLSRRIDIIFDPKHPQPSGDRHRRSITNYGPFDFIENGAAWIKSESAPRQSQAAASRIFVLLPCNNARARGHALGIFVSRDQGPALDMGIVNAGMLEVYEEIPEGAGSPSSRTCCSNPSRPTPQRRLVAYGESVKQKGGRRVWKKPSEEWRSLPRRGAPFARGSVKGHRRVRDRRTPRRPRAKYEQSR